MKRLTRTVSPGSDIQYKIHFAKYKSAPHIDNGVVLDITDHDGDGIPLSRGSFSCRLQNDPFFLIQVQAKDEENATTEENFVVKLQNVIEDLDQDGLEDYFDADDDGDGYADSLEVSVGSDPNDSNSTR